MGLLSFIAASLVRCVIAGWAAVVLPLRRGDDALGSRYLCRTARDRVARPRLYCASQARLCYRPCRAPLFLLFLLARLIQASHASLQLRHLMAAQGILRRIVP